MSSTIRYKSLDHLRGILALIVVLYHFSYWSGYEEKLSAAVSQPLSILGLYAVSAFYCLSGLALYVVYSSRIVDKAFLREFFVKRVFRIYPLFWVATTASLGFSGFVAIHDDPWRVFLSYSLLFSWVDPTAYFTTGAWSIGNEWAFYSLFPMLLVAWKYVWSKILVITMTIIITIYYAFFVIDPHLSVSAQWADYIDPLNQCFLFVGGMWIGSLIHQRTYPKLALPILIGASLVFLSISYIFDRGECVHGLLRLALVGVCFAWCYGAACFKCDLKRLGGVLDLVGKLSYSIYLLHPLVFRVVKKLIDTIHSSLPSFQFKETSQGILVFILAIIVTFVVSYLSFKLLERPMMKIGRKLATRTPKEV